MWDFITSAASGFAASLFSLTDQFNVFCLLGAVVTSFLWFTLSRRGSFIRRTRAFLRAGSWRRIWLHKSTVLDLKLFFVSGLLNAAGISGLFVVSYATSAATLWLFGRVMAPAPHAVETSVAIAVVMGALYWIVFDLGYWFAHFLMHRVPVLWEFHKVHHSAEVLTPLTEFRQHPIELFLFPLFTGTAVGVLFGAAEHLLGAERQGLTLVWINIVLFAYNMTLLHLRHSHVWIPLRGWLGYVLQSPAHHQIHHSTDPKHFDKNLGFGLSIWDWAFRTLYIPTKREVVAFGLGAESHEHDGVIKVMWLPFVKAGRLLRRDLAAPSSAQATQAAAPTASLNATAS